MPEVETGMDPWLSRRHSKCFSQCKALWSIFTKHWNQNCRRHKIPPYRPTNPDWNIAFRALGLDYSTVKKFWHYFCQVNISQDGQICMDEFLKFFGLDRTAYIEKTFQYFDTTGGGEVDFLEFVVSIWNVCSLDPPTLTNFTFDMYDVDSDGLLSCPEIESMVTELFGQDGVRGSLGLECMDYLFKLAEENGAITLDIFSAFASTHSMFMFPIYQIQLKLQARVMGLRFWKDLHNSRQKTKIQNWKNSKFWMRRNNKIMTVYKPRHILVLLRSFKRERGELDIDEADMLQCKNLREWIAKNEDKWKNDGWDQEVAPTVDIYWKKIKGFALKILSKCFIRVRKKRVHDLKQECTKASQNSAKMKGYCSGNSKNPAEVKYGTSVSSETSIQRRPSTAPTRSILKHCIHSDHIFQESQLKPDLKLPKESKINKTEAQKCIGFHHSTRMAESSSILSLPESRTKANVIQSKSLRPMTSTVLREDRRQQMPIIKQNKNKGKVDVFYYIN